MAPKARVQKRLYYKIGEACKALGIQPYVLRYWETEFPALSPSKSRSGQRVYSEKELEIIRRIKQLLYDEGYTIAGAKKKLEGELAAGTLGELGGSPVAQVASAPPAPPAAPVPFQTQAAARAGERASASIPAGEGHAGGAGAGGAAQGPARTVPLPLAPWAPADSKPDAAAMSAGPALAVAPAAPAGRDGSGSAAQSAAAEEPEAPGADPASSPGSSESPPALPLTPPPPMPAKAASAAGSPESAASAAPGASPRKATSRQAPIAAKAAAVAGDGAAGAATSKGSPAAASAPGHELDTNAAKQIETLRKGITKALQEAREILALLDARSPQ